MLVAVANRLADTESKVPSSSGMVKANDDGTCLRLALLSRACSSWKWNPGAAAPGGWREYRRLRAFPIWGIRGRWKKIAPTATKKEKGGGSAKAPALCEVCLMIRPVNPALLPAFSYLQALWTTALVLVSQGFGCPTIVQGLSKRIQWRGRELSNSAIIVAVVRLVLEGKLSAFSLRAVATFTLFNQVSRACPWFSPLWEASGRQSEICACSSVHFPAPSTEISCLQVSAKRPEPLKVSSPLTSGWASSSYSAVTGEQ